MVDKKLSLIGFLVLLMLCVFVACDQLAIPKLPIGDDPEEEKLCLEGTWQVTIGADIGGQLFDESLIDLAEHEEFIHFEDNILYLVTKLEELGQSLVVLLKEMPYLHYEEGRTIAVILDNGYPASVQYSIEKEGENIYLDIEIPEINDSTAMRLIRASRVLDGTLGNKDNWFQKPELLSPYKETVELLGSWRLSYLELYGGNKEVGQDKPDEIISYPVKDGSNTISYDYLIFKKKGINNQLGHLVKKIPNLGVGFAKVYYNAEFWDVDYLVNGNNIYDGANNLLAIKTIETYGTTMTLVGDYIWGLVGGEQMTRFRAICFKVKDRAIDAYKPWLPWED